MRGNYALSLLENLVIFSAKVPKQSFFCLQMAENALQAPSTRHLVAPRGQ